MKNKIFFILMLIASVLLIYLHFTGMSTHIALSVVGVLALLAFTFISRKEWKRPALHILQRVLFAVAFLTGVLILKVADIPAVEIVHKASAAAFVALLMLLYVPLRVKRI